MKDPHPVNLMSPEESRGGGWAAEARDSDGHLITQHAPFDGDAHLVDYVRVSIEHGLTVTIWPHKIGPRTLPSPWGE